MLGNHGLSQLSLRLVDYNCAWSPFCLLMLDLLFDVLCIGFVFFLLLIFISVSHHVLRCGRGRSVWRVYGSTRFILDVLFLEEGVFLIGLRWLLLLPAR